MLRQRRESVGVSVRTLATRAGFSPSFISQVENGLASPSIGSLEKIAACLQISLSELFHKREDAAIPVVRAKHRPRVESGWSRAEIESLRADGASRFDPILITLHSGGASGSAGHALSREQFVFVLSGEVQLTMHDTEQTLGPGDAVTLLPQTPVLWTNASKHPVQLLFVALAV
jgi:transcriptional regulator with XRE-family HTH domain